MRATLLLISLCAIALLDGCRHADDGAPDPGGVTLASDVREPRRAGAFDGDWTARSDAEQRRTGRWEDLGAAGWRGEGHRRDARSDDAPEERWPDRRSTPARTIADDELLVSLEARRLPDGVYEVKRTSPMSSRFTEEEFQELLRRINARESWIKVIRVGPWRIRVVRDSFFDPYRRDSGWIDLDNLDGPHGR